MCGIAGFFGSRPDEAARAVAAGIASIRHRGPDGERVEHVDHLGAIGMCRLAIRDLSPAGMQPRWHDQCGIVFNGEIYNTAELTKILTNRGHIFDSTGDTEVLLKTYLEFGTDAFAMLDGIFAVGIVDHRKRQLHLARDEFGVKPLFVEESAGRLLFASEPKALRAMGGLRGGPQIDHLELYLRYQYVPEPLTAWAGVRRVPRATVETFDLRSLHPTNVSTFRQPVETTYATVSGDDAWVEATEDALTTSVRRQMVSDRPLGVFLSGGIDSTLVSALASDAHPSVKAFGISVPGWDQDERRYIEEACQRLDVTLTLGELTEGDFDRLADRVIATYDEPFGDFSSIPTMLVSEIASRDLLVVLSGDGGDELFGGYTRYADAVVAERAGNLPVSVIRATRSILDRVGRGPWRFTDRLTDEVAAGGCGYSSLLAIRSAGDAAALLGRAEPLRRPLVEKSPGRIWSEARIYEHAMRVDTDQYLPADINTKVDRASMAFSLEARSPLIGAPAARLSDVMPIEVKIRNGVGKWPLKEVLRRRGFSHDFVHRPKTGFSFPMDAWLRRAIARRPEFEDALRSPPEPIDAIASRAGLDALLGGTDNGHAVWSLLVLSLWLGEVNS